MQDTATLTVPFESGHEQARWVTYLLASTIIVALISAVSNYMQIELLSKAINGETITESEASSNDSRQQMVGIFQILLLISTAVVFLMWFHRVHRNLPSLGTKNLKYTPGWAVGGFFVPFLNIVRPFQVAREIWNASDPDSSDGTSWQGSGTPSIVGWWWGLLLITSFLGNIAGRMALKGPDTLEGLMSMSWLDIGSNLVDIPAALLAIALVNGIDKRQESKFNRMSSTTIQSSQPT